MELVTGKAGTPHVSSADDGRRIAGEVGAGSYVLKTGGGLAPSLVDANTVRFATGDMVVQGRHIGLTAPEDVKVASGTQGKKRRDYICVRYKRDVSGSNPTLVETCEWKVLQGTPGTKATAPTVPAGSILDGDSEATVPVASVDFDGLTTGTPKLLIPTLTPLADLGDSVSRIALSQTISLGQSDDSLIAWRRGNIVTVDYRRVTSGFYSGNAGALTRLGTMPNGLRPRREIRVPMVGDVYLCVGSDGFIGLYNYGSAKTYALGFGAIITYCV